VSCQSGLRPPSSGFESCSSHFLGPASRRLSIPTPRFGCRGRSPARGIVTLPDYSFQAILLLRRGPSSERANELFSSDVARCQSESRRLVCIDTIELSSVCIHSTQHDCPSHVGCDAIYSVNFSTQCAEEILGFRVLSVGRTGLSSHRNGASRKTVSPASYGVRSTLCAVSSGDRRG
jgi:hypothetical protein